MKKTNNYLILALFFPIVVLAALTGYRQYNFSYGKEIILPIGGYDPRDLLSGHYLIYQINYGIDGICSNNKEQQTAYVCLEPKMFSYYKPENCSLFIKGECNYNRFEAGIEKYFIAEEDAKYLEEKAGKKELSIALSVLSDGRAQVKDLLVSN